MNAEFEPVTHILCCSRSPRILNQKLVNRQKMVVRTFQLTIHVVPVTYLKLHCIPWQSAYISFAFYSTSVLGVPCLGQATLPILEEPRRAGFAV